MELIKVMGELSEIKRLAMESLHGKKFLKLSYEERQLLARLMAGDKMEVLEISKNIIIFKHHVK
jgi:hypothetical protein